MDKPLHKPGWILRVLGSEEEIQDVKLGWGLQQVSYRFPYVEWLLYEATIIVLLGGYRGKGL